MATELFRVKVLDKEETKVVLQLRIITGEQPDFFSSESFALMLIHDPVYRGKAADAPLGREVSIDNVLDPDWAYENVDKYIAGVRLYDIKNYPPTDELDRMTGDERREFYDSDAAPTAKFEIRVTSPEWVEHIRPGMEWETTAFDLME